MTHHDFKKMIQQIKSKSIKNLFLNQNHLY